MMKLFLILLIPLLLIFFLLGYFGFIPLISSVMGSNKPKNLDIKYTETDKKAAEEKLQVKFGQLEANATESGLVLKGYHPVDKLFSSRELTALADTRQKQFGQFPFKQVQIKVNKDGSVEGSGILEFNTALDYLQLLGVPLKQVNQAVDKLKILKGELPVYLKANGEVINNSSEIKIISAEIARIPVPQSLINQYGPGINSLVEDIIDKRKPHYNIQFLKVENGQVRFTGSSPDEELARGRK